MKAACQTCEWNFGPQKKGTGRVCANTYYGEYIKDIQKENRECDGWDISFEEFVRQKTMRYKG